LAPLDLAIVVLYLGLTLFWGARHARRAGRSTEEFFAAGRSLPWWLAGTSIAATMFASDTPLAIAGLVATEGIAGNWFWWADVLPLIIGALVIAELWKRSGVLTDTELTEMRYTGTRAAGLRVFRALYFGVLRNAIVIGWVNLAMLKVLGLVFDLTETQELWLLAALFTLTLIYTGASGLIGVVFTDVMQFVLAMVGAITLAVLAVGHVGGLEALAEAVRQAGGANQLDFVPPGGSEAFWAFVIYIALKSWASGNTEGSGYIAQRILATRDERHARLAGLWYIVATFALRPWPWILVGLVAMIDHPGLADPEEGYVRVMLARMPTGMLGLMVASFLAAFMSTIDTHLNWGASYLTHDIYHRFVRPDAEERRLVLVARLSVLLLAVLGAFTTLVMESIAGAWMFLASISAGYGLIGLLRWIWWRINAWSEIAVMTASIVSTNVVMFLTDITFPFSLVIVVAVSVPIALAATLLTEPEPLDTLRAFHARVRPPGFWGPVAPDAESANWIHALRVVCGTAGVYAWMLGGGWLLLGRPVGGLVALVFGALALAVATVSISGAPVSEPPAAPPRT
jgi:Na+/proline symporter